jgi:protein-tyrosine phosphatase
VITLIKPMNGERVTLRTDEQNNFIKNENRRAFTDGTLSFQWDALVCVGLDRSIPCPVTLSWETVYKTVTVFISDNIEMEDEHSYFIPAGKGYCEIYNLNIGKTYYWRVESAEETSPVFYFSISYDTPRSIYVEGITNVRDIGGYKTISGKRIRQNMVYRGSELDSHLIITDKGIKTLCEELKIKTDLDMRGEAAGIITEGPLSPLGVVWKLIPLCPYDDIFNEENKRQYGVFFKEFTQPELYPIYFHCWGGADRAGTFAFLLGALLGMEINELINEYEWTSLSIWGIRTRNYDKFQNFLKGLDNFGDVNNSLQQKAENFIISAGLTKNEIQIIRNLLLE